PNPGGTYGGITLSGNGTVQLSAPGSGTYAGLVLHQPSANTRAVALSGNAAQGLSGTLYAPSALAYLSGNAALHGALVVGELTLSGNAASSLSVDGGASSAFGVAGQLLAGDLAVYVSDAGGAFTADQRARIHDAVAAVDAVVEPYAVAVFEVGDP